ncbi:MAG: hypothetical protein IPK63_22600 [Candidatus Competibacteraceae bacterium]|nr:hypothetical protein [Candidatus Competibacteraceae bacterium]
MKKKGRDCRTGGCSDANEKVNAAGSADAAKPLGFTKDFYFQELASERQAHSQVCGDSFAPLLKTFQGAWGLGR